MILFREHSSIFTDTSETLVEVLVPDFSKRYLRSSAVEFFAFFTRVDSRPFAVCIFNAMAGRPRFRGSLVRNLDRRRDWLA